MNAPALLPPPAQPCDNSLEAHRVRLGEAWQALKASTLPRNSGALTTLMFQRGYRRHIDLLTSMLSPRGMLINPVDVQLVDVSVLHVMDEANKQNIHGGITGFYETWGSRRDLMIETLDWQASHTWVHQQVLAGRFPASKAKIKPANIDRMLKERANLHLYKLVAHIVFVERIA